MSNTELLSPAAADKGHASALDMSLEVVVVPVTDVDRAKCFYAKLGWRLDLDFSKGDDYRVIQFTPPGSRCSIILGKNVTPAAPGSLQGPLLVVSDIVSTRDELLRRGIEVGEIFHDAGGVFHCVDAKTRRRGPNPQRRSYASFAPFSDPDGNGWLLQEVTARLPGTVETRDRSFTPEIVNELRKQDKRT
jgi:catechol 2,3-dioxygenase-like lactoylglutathione lyase family enzyme